MTEEPDDLLKDCTRRIIGAAIEVHKALGPGLLESAYEACLAREFDHQGIGYRRQVDLPVHYRDLRLDAGYRLDFVVEDQVIVELKSVERIMPIHEAQLLTYLRLAEKRVGLLINFNVPVLRRGIVRRVLSPVP
jgi:GxxExxY protein